MPYRSPLLDVPGSIPPPDDHPEAGVPWHWGDPFAEQRTASRGVVVIDRSHREFIAVTGEERLSWLHLVISQHVTGLAEGSGTEALVLDSQGRVESHMVLAHIDGTVWLDTNGNGQLDAGEQPLAGVRLVAGSGRDTLTDENGIFRFGDLPPGEHVILVDEKTLPEKTVSTHGTLTVKVLAGSETVDINFPITAAAPEIKRFPSAGN